MIFFNFHNLTNLFKDVLSLEERYVKDQINRMFELVSVEELMKSLSLNISFEHLLEFLKLEDIYQLFQPYTNFEYNYITLFFKAYSLKIKIVLCHHELVNMLRSLLGRKKIRSVEKALEEAREIGLIDENEYKILIKFNKLRNEIHHEGYLSHYDERIISEIRYAEEIVRNVISNVRSRDLKCLVECLQETHIIF
jgi:uncharacterized protein YutE (UPF0331/DUF86 family)